MKFAASLTLLVLLITFSGFAADIYPNQPKLNAAHNHLMSARRQLDRVDVSGGLPSSKLLDDVVVSLNTASKYLVDAKKNKGSHRDVAIKRIDQTKALIEKLRTSTVSVSAVLAEVNATVTEVKEAARAGRD